MSKNPISPEFSAKAGERELEVFLLPDEARKELQKILARDATEQAKQQAEQQRRRAQDIHEAKIKIAAERLGLELAPPWKQRARTPKEPELQATAELRVDSQNRADRNALLHQQQQRQDAFLAKQKEERVLREGQERQAVREHSPASAPSLKRDFDRSR